MIKKIVFQLMILLIVLIVGFTASFVSAQDLPYLKTITFEAGVEFSPDNGTFTYTYTVTNPSTNKGDIWSIEIDISKPTGGTELSKEGLVNGPGYLEHTSQAIAEQTIPGITTVPMIPVGLSSPPDWSSGLSVVGTAGWGSSDDALFLPGQTLNDFLMTSRGLPGIRAFKVEPYLDVDLLAEAGFLIYPESNEDLEKYKKDLKTPEDSVSVKGKTIGPTAPPANFVAIDFLSYLVDLKHQAFELGWITNKGVENSLDAKLDQVKAKLQAGDTKTASNLLNAFLNELDAQGCESYDNCPKGKHLTPEAWGLLYFNGEYLLERL